MSANQKNQSAVDFLTFSAAVVFPALAWVFIPLVSVIAVLIIPVSLAVLVRRQDLRYGLFSILLMVAVITVVTAKLQLALLLAMQTGPLGILLGLLFKNHVPSGRALVATVAFSLAVSLGTLLAGYLVTGASPLALNERQRYVFNQERRLISQMFGQDGPAGELDPGTIKELEMVIDRVEAFWPVLAVSSALIWFMVVGLVTYGLSRRLMIRFGYSVPAAVLFSRWRLPWYVIWGGITGLALLLGGDHLGSQGLAAAGKVILWVTGFIFSVIGASVHAFYLQRWKVARIFKLLGLVLAIVYLPVAAGVLATTGVIDSIWNIRRLTPEGRTPEEEDKK